MSFLYGLGFWGKAGLGSVFVGGLIHTAATFRGNYFIHSAMESGTFSPGILSSLSFLRRVVGVDQAEDSGSFVSEKENPGLYVMKALMTPTEREALFQEVETELLSTCGQPLLKKKQIDIAEQLSGVLEKQQAQKNGGLETSTLNEGDKEHVKLHPLAVATAKSIRCATDYDEEHDEGCPPNRLPWRPGDALRRSALPSTLRSLENRIREQSPNIGRLRHVHCEYYPKGTVLYKENRNPEPLFSGMEYILFPVERISKEIIARNSDSPSRLAAAEEDWCDGTFPEKQQDVRHYGSQTAGMGKVFTFSPAYFSKPVSLVEQLSQPWHSFTDRDLDVFVPPGSAVYVMRKARGKYVWGIRPGNFFGDLSCKLPLAAPMLAPTALSPAQSPITKNKFVEPAKQRFYQPQLPPEAIMPITPLEGDTLLLLLGFEGCTGSQRTERKKAFLWEPMCFGQEPVRGEWNWGQAPSPDIVEGPGFIPTAKWMFEQLIG